MRITRTKESFTGKIYNQEYSDILFEELVVDKAIITKSKFKNIHFKNSYIGFDSKYLDCTFDSCKFFGRYSSLGTPKGNLTKYDLCNFVDCSFTGLEIFDGTNFIKCKFTGLIKNIILRDAQGKLQNMGTQFSDCDLEGLRFDNISIYGKRLFLNTKLPKSGLRFYMNTNDSLIKRAKDICSKIIGDYKIQSEVIFNESTRSGQDLIILDEIFIKSFFKNDDSRELFNEIVKDFEIKTTSI